ncbi:jg15818 [Pararge aegeria aegeria]|uniref:Jg15818 protein n=1 Tax=Pararge aegeria aegeria TaxID=348720 RepID=A0A8S4S6Y7_9NEOP|nr:jg15818 [Pararge aegeria aegeria]
MLSKFPITKLCHEWHAGEGSDCWSFHTSNAAARYQSVDLRPAGQRMVIPPLVSRQRHTTQLGEPMDVGVPRCWNGDPAPVNAALVGPQRVAGSCWEPETSGPRPWILELPTKDLSPAVDFKRLK